MSLIEKKISNHKILTNLERTVSVHGFLANDGNKEVIIYYNIYHSKEGDEINIIAPYKEWRISNEYSVTVRDENNQPLPNPEYEEYVEGELDTRTPEQARPYITMPAYDYFKRLTFDSLQPVSIKQLLNYYILQNDLDGFFDFY